MRLRRLAFVFLAFYFVFLGGSAYFALVFPIRVFHHAFVTMLLALWLVHRLRRKRGLPVTTLNPPIYAAAGIWLVTSITSLDLRMAFENIWLPLTHVLIFFVLVDLFQRGQQRLVMETQFLLAAVVVFISGLELASWYFGLGIVPGTDIGWKDVIGPGAWLPLQPPRLSLAMNISTLLAAYVAPLITLSAGWALTVRRRDYAVALWAVAALLAVVLLLTFSRGGLISLAAGAGLLIALRAVQTPGIVRRISARVLVGLGALVGVAAVVFLMVITLSPSRQSGDEGRLDMWVSAVDITRNYPLLGVGPGMFGRAFRDYRDPEIARDKLASAHNAYLNTAAETGIAGIAVSLWLGVVFLRAWWQRWKKTDIPARKIRLETTLAALAGLGVHSLVDAFTVTPIVILIALLAAYSIVGHRSRLDTPPDGHRLPAVIALVIVIAYGVWFFQIDRAQSHYQNSFRGDETALDEARTAAAMDPGLRLYTLQIAYLLGQQTVDNPEADVSAAIEAYQSALELEPTWDTGWINLAALVEQQGDIATAINHLDTAWQISDLNTAPLHWARLSEPLAPEAQVLDAYLVGINLTILNPDLPLSDFWIQTDLRRRTMESYTAVLPLDWRYRILVVHEPQQAYALVPSEPETAAEWWVAGEYALTIQNDAAKASVHFTEAINQNSTNGDYYVSRARAQLSINPDAARHDLDIAQLLGTRFEYPNAVRALLAETSEEKRAYQMRALPGRGAGQEFAAVLYGRPAQFDVFPEMKRPGPGRSALQPWYDLAEQDIIEGRIEEAVRTYQAILYYAPFEAEAREKLNLLLDIVD